MRCPQCEQPNAPDSRFCLRCGTRLVATCSACGTDAPPDARFCAACGVPLAAAPDSYTPKRLAEKILTARSALEGERKQVTVLFADIRSSMELVANRDPEDVRRLLDPALDLMMEAVHRYEGTVNQVLGDGIMALFGAPLAHEDHAVRACHAALRMQSSLRRYSEDVEKKLGLPFRVRVGLHSGEVVVRSIGNDLHMDYTAVGQTTHLAARMEQQAAPDTICLTGDTARLAEGYVDLKALGPMMVRGLAAPVEVYELLGPGPARSRLHVAVARGLTRFVGRVAELDRLTWALERAAIGNGQVVGVVGEAGVGKSRLVWEFVHSPRAAGWLVLEGTCAPYGPPSAHLPIIEMLRKFFDIDEYDDAAQLQAVVAERLPTAAERARFLAPLLTLLDVPVADSQWEALDPRQRRQRTLEAIRHLLLSRSRVEPICLVVQDLHWIDAETQAVLDAVVSSLAGGRLVVLVTFRPTYQHTWSGFSHYSQVWIDPLAGASAEALLHDLLGDDPEVAALGPMLLERTEGNPFFIEETVRHLVDTGVLTGRTGAYRLTGLPAVGKLPATVQAVLAARIDRLSAADKELLQAASVIGRDVPVALLQAITDLSDAELHQRLRGLRAVEFVYEAGRHPEPHVAFRHGLTLEVAYESLLHERRRGLDARVVEALERLYPERPVEQLERLAHHARRGEVWDKAVLYCREAGNRAFVRSAHGAAVTHLEHALDALTHLPPSRANTELAIDIRVDLRSALTPLADFGRMLEHLQAAETLARAIADQARLGLVASFLANYFTVMFDLPRAIEYGESARRIAEDLHDLRLEVVTNAYLGTACYFFGDYARATTLSRRNATLLEGERAAERFGMALFPAVYSRTVLALSVAETGAFAEGLVRADEAIRIAETVDHAHSLVFACLGLGLLRHRRGEFEGATVVLQRAFDLCQSADISVAMSTVVAPLASSLARSGRVDEAIALLRLAVQRAIAIGDPLGRWLRTAGFAEAYLLSGRADEALPLARRAVDLTRATNTRGTEVQALLLLTEIAALHEPAAADEPLARARTLASQLGMRPAIARCHLLHGELARRRGERVEAAAALTQAATIFGALGMDSYRARALGQ
jgi:class 3 adenylate cyclase/tetratricopeptide (TPR) repeat protein